MASRLLSIQARCCECAWTSSARNALATAHRHAESRGHYVKVDQLTETAFGLKPVERGAVLDFIDAAEAADAAAAVA